MRFLRPLVLIVIVPLPSVSVLLLRCTLVARITTVAGAVSTIVTVHGNDEQVTLSVTVDPLLVAPPLVVAEEIASTAWNDLANTEPLSVQLAQPCPAALTALVRSLTPPAGLAFRTAVEKLWPPSAL